MGPSGSGKSTLMNILGCLDTPTSGSYRFKGIEVETLNKDQRSLLRRHALGFVFQGFNLLARTSALENVELPLLYRGDGCTAQRHEMAGEALAQVSLDGQGAQHPGRTFRRPAAARRHRPRHRHRTAGAVRRRTHRQPRHQATTARSWTSSALNRDRGISIIMVTHEDEIAAYARRIIHVRDGVDRSDRVTRKLPARCSFNALQLALREIRRNLMRSFLTVIGIVIGVAAVITMVTLGRGATAMVTEPDFQNGQQPAHPPSRARRGGGRRRADVQLATSMPSRARSAGASRRAFRSTTASPVVYGRKTGRRTVTAPRNTTSRTETGRSRPAVSSPRPSSGRHPSA